MQKVNQINQGAGGELTTSNKCISGREKNNLINYITDLKNIFITIILSVDFITFSIKHSIEHLTTMFTLIRYSDFDSDPTFVRHKTSNYYNWEKIYLFKFNNRSYRISILKRNKHYLPYELRIDDPDEAVVRFLHSHLCRSYYHIQELELTWDFYGKDKILIFNKLNNIFQLSYVTEKHQVDLDYKDTKYYGDPRNTKTKGSRIYMHPKNAVLEEQKPRLEVIFKRDRLKNSNIENIPDLLALDNYLVTKYMRFKQFNDERFKKNYERRSLKGDKDCVSNVAWVINQINSLIINRNVMSADRFARQYISYSCFEPHPFEAVFKNGMVGKSFLNNDIIQLDSTILLG